ncbi:hypothetical protein VHUM_03738 [Vanrija humicola]|uniref:Amidohydrolase 3 domain-containing protein n=1 Tax=Vanrija humicola TaxID=5417 RepID=A0A7D8UWK4_VANHU|nr:hypothetical protein VHUM_03738 [Vanrija humicola]
MTVALDTPLPSPKTLFTNASLVGWPAGTYSVLVEHGTVVAASTSPIKARDATVIDLAGLWLSPSLVDWHTHWTKNLIGIRRYSLEHLKSAAAVLEAVAARVDDPEWDEDGFFVAVNMRSGEWPDTPALNRLALDAISSAKPICLNFNGHHSYVCNTKGLEFVGFSPETHPDGILYETDAFKLSVALTSRPDADLLDTYSDEMGRHAASLGVTEIVDLEMAFNDIHWQRRFAKGFKGLRVHTGIYPQHLDRALEKGFKTGDAVPGTHGQVTIGPFKLVTDGSLGSATAYCKDPYPNSCNHGLLTHGPGEIDALCLRATQSSLRLAVQAIGDEALRHTLDALDAHKAAGFPPLAGSTIEHAQLVDAPEIPRFKELGLVASIQPRHLVDDAELAHCHWPGREGRAYAFKTLHDAGIPLRMGSDCPIAPLQPWEAIACAIARSGGNEQAAFEPQEIIDVETAYAASTSNGRTGIDVGGRADLVVIDADPLTLDAEGIRRVKVLGTLLGGNWTHKAKGFAV